MWVKLFKIYIYLSILQSHVFLEGRNTETYIWGRGRGVESLAMLWEVEGMLQIVPTQKHLLKKKRLFSSFQK